MPSTLWSRALAFAVREGTSLVFTLVIWSVIWGGYQPGLDTPEQALRYAFLAGGIALGYLGLQALTVVTQPLARETRYLLDLLLSLLPAALIGYAATQALSGQLSLTPFQHGVLWLAGLACAVDIIVFTWFNMKLNKLASDFVPMR